VIGVTAAVSVAYFLAARLSLFLVNQPDGVAIFWPAAGISSGALIALGRPAWLPVAVGIIIGNGAAALTDDRTLMAALAYSLCNVIEALLVAFLVERTFGSRFSLDTLHRVLGFLLIAVFATGVSSVAATLPFKLLHSPDVPAVLIWENWFASDVIGIIAVAPLLIGVADLIRVPPSGREVFEGSIALLATVLATAGAMFILPQRLWDSDVLIALLFPFILWIASRCQPAFASIAAFIISLIVMALVAFKFGHFGLASPSSNILVAQFSILGVTVCALVLAALFAERRQHDALVTESEARLQEALAVGSVIAFDWDVTTGSVRTSHNTSQIIGLEPPHVFDGNSFLSRIHPDDFVRLKSVWSTLNRDNPKYSMSYRFRRPDGREIWLQETSKAEFDGAGEMIRVKGLTLDITERKRAEERQKLLNAELDHRVKNALAQVAVITESSRQKSNSIDDFIGSLKGRIQSMAAAHALLSQSSWQDVDLSALVHTQLAPYANSINVSIAGPSVLLTSAETQAIAMVLHELVTNAAKYGALSNSNGRVSTSWELKSTGPAASTLKIVWRELGGPPVEREIRPGYGTSLIRDLVPHELGGRVDVAFASDGVCCTIEIPREQE